MTEAEDWKRQLLALEDDNFDLYRQLRDARHEIALLRIALANTRTSNNLLKEAQQEGMEF